MSSNGYSKESNVLKWSRIVVLDSSQVIRSLRCYGSEKSTNL